MILEVKNLPANAGDIRDADLIPGLGRCPGEGNGNSPLVFLPGKSYGQRSLAGYSPWNHKYMSYIANYISVQFSHSVVSNSL